MDVMDDELLKFWLNLNTCEVQYILVGGLAVRLHGYNRTTDDIDIWINDTLTNRKNLRKAFNNLGYGDFKEIETMQFVAGLTSFYAAGMEVDFMTNIPGLESLNFETCFDQAAIIEFSDSIQVRFLHLNHLILAKRATNRPKDQLDIQYLEKINHLNPPK
jgi:hypothetical protein